MNVFLPDIPREDDRPDDLHGWILLKVPDTERYALVEFRVDPHLTNEQVMQRHLLPAWRAAVNRKESIEKERLASA